MTAINPPVTFSAAATVVVPCYNERPLASDISTRIERLVATEPKIDWEFLFVDDGSDDGTEQAIERVLPRGVCSRFVKHAKNQGIAAAILSGARAARHDIVCTIDADGTYDLSLLPVLIDRLASGPDVATASPYHPLGTVTGVPRWRVALSQLASLLYRRVFRTRLSCYTCCVRAYRRAAIHPIELQDSGFAGVTEILWHLEQDAAWVVEVPAKLTARAAGASKSRVLRGVLTHGRLWARILAGRMLQRVSRPARPGPEPARSHRPPDPPNHTLSTRLEPDPETNAMGVEIEQLSLPSDQDHTGRTLGAEELAAVSAVLQSGKLTSTTGQFTRVLERRFADLLGVEHALACSSGSAAIHTAVAAVDPEPGDEIVTTPITDMGALTPILYQSAIPVFADVDPCTCNVTANTIEAVLSSRTRAIIATHLFGNPCPMDRIMDLARRRGIPVIEDAAQAYLATCGDRVVGSIGDIGCFSLQQGKHMTSGEGGLITTRHSDFARRMYRFVNKGWDYQDPRPDHTFLALNYRMSELQAAVATAQLEKLGEMVARRRAMAARLTARLGSAAGLDAPESLASSRHAFWRYPLRVNSDFIRGGPIVLADALRQSGIASAPRYIRRPAFACAVFATQRTFGASRFPFTLARPEAIDYDPRRFPGVAAGLAQLLVLPFNERYRDAHVDTLAEALLHHAEALRQRGDA